MHLDFFRKTNSMDYCTSLFEFLISRYYFQLVDFNVPTHFYLHLRHLPQVQADPVEEISHEDQLLMKVELQMIPLRNLLPIPCMQFAGKIDLGILHLDQTYALAHLQHHETLASAPRQISIFEHKLLVDDVPGVNRGQKYNNKK